MVHKNRTSQVNNNVCNVCKVTLLSALVSSALPFCKTTLLRKQLILQYYSVDRKSVKRTLFYIVLSIERYANRNVSIKAGFVNYFPNFFVDLRKVDLSPKLLEKFLVFFPYILS